MLHNFSHYADLGLCVMPLRGKLPVLPSWKPYQEKRPAEWLLKSWDNAPHNIGIITGHISGLLVVDIDGPYPEDWPEMPKTWTARTAKGRHYYFALDPEAEYKNATRIAPNVDIRANGGYVVAPPSRHPDGGKYEWIAAPEDCKLAPVPDWLAEKLTKKADPYKPAPAPARTADNRPYIEAAIKSECEILQAAGQGTRNDQLNTSAIKLAGLIPASEVKNILTPIALSIGLTPKEIEKTIKSATDAATPREIPDNFEPPPPEAPSPLVQALLKKHRNIAEDLPEALIRETPGLPGALIRWILGTSLYPQPVLALAAALPTIGNVMAHRVASETDLRTNFFTLGIADSGAGKDHARECISKLYALTNLTDTLAGDPASATAVINAVKRSGGRAFMRIDEMGRFMDSIKGNNAASHARQITTNMMHMYNSAKTLFIGNEYANNEAVGGRSDIDQPCLNVYGTTVPHRFYGALTSSEAFDGFLSRWLVFETKRFDIDPIIDNHLTDPPAALVEAVQWWNNQPTYAGDAGTIASYTTIQPRIIPYTDSARRAFYALIKDCRAKMAASDNPIEKAFWNRTAEHAGKIALAVHSEDKIDSNAFEWAAQLARHLTILTIGNISSKVSDSKYEENMLRVLSVIKSQGEATLSDIIQVTRSIDRRMRFDIIGTLIESGDIIETTRATATKPAKVYNLCK